MGRKAIPIDWDLVGRLASVHCPVKDIAACAKVDPDTLRIACFKKFKLKLADWCDMHRAGKRRALREAQLDLALAGNPTMQIWLGKQMLGQVDRLEKIDKEWARKQDKGELLALAEKAIEVVKQAAEGGKKKK